MRDAAFQSIVAVAVVFGQMAHADRNSEIFAALKVSCPGYIHFTDQKREREEEEKKGEPLPTAGTDEGLTANLVHMAAEDQRARRAAIDAGGYADQKSVPQEAEVLNVDRTNLKALREIITASGIPTYQQVGRAGMIALWTLIQHADSDVSLQEMALNEFAKADSGLPREQIALLTDRVRIHQGKLQLFGTQFQGGQPMRPSPIEDERHVDERRKAMDFPPLADYACMLRVAYSARPGE
jgi:hypothetical protein